MKLIFCPHCQDVVKLQVEQTRHCSCGKSSGKYYADGLNARIRGDAIPIGFNNNSFATALANRESNFAKTEFTAFVIKLPCETVKTEEECSKTS